jgi:hypothetical protein
MTSKWIAQLSLKLAVKLDDNRVDSIASNATVKTDAISLFLQRVFCCHMSPGGEILDGGTFMMFFRQNRWSTLNTAA